MMAVLMTSVADAGRHEETFHQGRPLPEPGQSMAETIGGPPEIFDYPRKPFEGLRLVVTKLVHRNMPPVVPTPSKVIAPHARGYDRAPGTRGAPVQDRAAVQYVSVSGIERPAWYEHLT